MAIRTRYRLLTDGNTRASEGGSFYPDIMTLPIQRFRFSEPPLEYYLTQKDIDRPDLLMYRIYSTSEFDDIIFWLNGLPYISEVAIGTKILLPARQDLEDFFLENQV